MKSNIRSPRKEKESPLRPIVNLSVERIQPARELISRTPSAADRNEIMEAPRISRSMTPKPSMAVNYNSLPKPRKAPNKTMPTDLEIDEKFLTKANKALKSYNSVFKLHRDDDFKLGDERGGTRNDEFDDNEDRISYTLRTLADKKGVHLEDLTNLGRSLVKVFKKVIPKKKTEVT